MSDDTGDQRLLPRDVHIAQIREAARAWRKHHGCAPEETWLSKLMGDGLKASTFDRIDELVDEIARLRSALARVAEPKAFHVSTSRVDPEAYGRMVFAQKVLEGIGPGTAEEIAEREVRERHEKTSKLPKFRRNRGAD